MFLMCIYKKGHYIFAYMALSELGLLAVVVVVVVVRCVCPLCYGRAIAAVLQ